MMNCKWPLMPRVMCTSTVSSRLSNKNIDTRYFYSPSFTWKLLQAQGPKGVRKKRRRATKKIAHIWSKVRDVTEKESPNAIHLMLAKRREHKKRAEKQLYYDVCVVGHWAMPPLTWLGSLIWFAKKSFSFLTFNYRYWKSSAPFTAWLCNIL